MGLGTFLKKYSVYIIILLVVLPISIAGLVMSLKPQTPYTESLFNTSLNDTTLKSTAKKEILYSYPIVSGDGKKSGSFTIVVDGPFEIPLISFGVEDEFEREISQGIIRVGKVTEIPFEGKSNSTIVNLMIHPLENNIQLKNISITLNR